MVLACEAQRKNFVAHLKICIMGMINYATFNCQNIHEFRAWSYNKLSISGSGFKK